MAWVRLKPGVEATEEEIKEFCKGQIAYYKVPEHVRFCHRIPGDAQREDTEIQDSRVRDRGAGVAVGGGRGYGVRTARPAKRPGLKIQTWGTQCSECVVDRVILCREAP